jgi:hypothetical protein
MTKKPNKDNTFPVKDIKFFSERSSTIIEGKIYYPVWLELNLTAHDAEQLIVDLARAFSRRIMIKKEDRDKELMRIHTSLSGDITQTTHKIEIKSWTEHRTT